MTLPQRDQYLYQACYCEENIWQLCQRPEFMHSEAVVIAALGDCFPILQQRAATAAYLPVLWDYHVVLLWHTDDGDYIIDFDTTLPFCTPLADYVQHSFFDERRLPANLRPLFRVIPAQQYVSSLQSDRRHMKTADGWLAEPPAWLPISENTSNLQQFINMKDHHYGQIMTTQQLLSTNISASLC